MLAVRRFLIAIVASCWAPCLTLPAIAQRVGLEDRDAVARALDARLPADRAKARAETLHGLLRHVLLHEIGHFLISEYRISKVGREEDMADRFAAFALGSSAPMTEILAPVRIWLAHARQRPAAASRSGVPRIAWDEHSLDEQRAAQHICLVAGRDPALFDELFPRFGAPVERALKCVREAEDNAQAWRIVLEPQVVSSEETKDKGNARLNTIFGIHQLRQATRVIYDDPPVHSPELKTFLQDSKHLEEIADVISTFRRPRWRVDLIKILATNELVARCGEKKSPLTSSAVPTFRNPESGPPRARDTGCDTDLNSKLGKPSREQKLDQQKARVLNAPVVVAAKTCGGPNAYFQPGSAMKPYLEREVAEEYSPPMIVLCYEFISYSQLLTQTLFPDP